MILQIKNFFQTLRAIIAHARNAAHLSENTRAGLAKRVGKVRIGAIAPIGYKYKGVQLEIDCYYKKTVKRLFKIFLKEGNTCRTATRLNKLRLRTTRGKRWSHHTVRQILMNPVYVGDTVWGRRGNRRLGQSNRLSPKSRWVIKRNTHKALISRKTFRKVQKLLTGNYR
jgi:DNA invertase Pin-like site-specific DNA recombinase